MTLYAISVWDMCGVVLLAVLTQSLSMVIQSVTDVVIVCLTQHLFCMQFLLPMNLIIPKFKVNENAYLTEVASCLKAIFPSHNLTLHG
jgi:hypothetical protein